MHWGGEAVHYVLNTCIQRQCAHAQGPESKNKVKAVFSYAACTSALRKPGMWQKLAVTPQCLVQGKPGSLSWENDCLCTQSLSTETMQ